MKYLKQKSFLSALATFAILLAVVPFAYGSYSPTASPSFGEMYLDANSTATVIDTQNATHLLHGIFTAGSLKHFSFVAGTRGTDITTMATYDGGASTLISTTASHNLSANQYISITATTNYNEIYKVLSAPSATTFEIDKAWDGNNDATGTYIRGDALIANGQSAGDYSGDHYISSVVATNSDDFLAYTVINGQVCPKCKTRRTYGVGADYGTTSGHAIATGFQDGTVIQYGIMNLDGTGNFTAEFGNIRLIRH